MNENTTPYKEITSGGYTYQVYPVTGRAILHLDRKVTDIAYSLRSEAKSREDFGLKIIHTFAEMDNYVFDELIEQTLVNVVRVGNDGESNIRVTPDNIYDLFVGDLDGLYGLLLAIWGAYELTPFRKAKASNTGA